MGRGLATAVVSAAVGVAGVGYYVLVTGKMTIDTGMGRRISSLGPFSVQITAPAGTVFDVIAAPYLERTPRAMADKLHVLDRGADMVLAEHYTPVHGGRLTPACRASLPPGRHGPQVAVLTVRQAGGGRRRRAPAPRWRTSPRRAPAQDAESSGP